MSENILLHPEWRQAMAQILELKPKPGDVIPKAWLEQIIGLQEAKNVEQWQARQLKWLRQFEKLRDELLTVHGIWLRASGDGGYEVVPPSKQTELAYSDYSRQAFLKLKRMTRVAQHVRLSELTDAERAENRNTLAKMATLVGMVGGAMIEDKRASDSDTE